MARKPLIGALLLLAVGVVLGTTVFRADIAQATGLAPAPSSVVVTNTPAQAVPTREQNLDSSGHIRVAVQPAYIVINGGGSITCSTANSPCCVPGGAVATALNVTMTGGVSFLDIESCTPLPGSAASFLGPASGGSASFVLALTYPLAMDAVACHGGANDVCIVGWMGSSSS